MRRGTKLLIGLMGAVAFWFLGVDWVWEVETCPDCHFVRDSAHHRVLGISIINNTNEQPSDLGTLLSDLGVPCEHQNLTHWRKHRWWGFVFCSCPCVNGVYLVTNNGWYEDEVFPYIYQYAEDHPDAGARFWKMIETDDVDGIAQIWSEVVRYGENR